MNLEKERKKIAKYQKKVFQLKSASIIETLLKKIP